MKSIRNKKQDALLRSTIIHTRLIFILLQDHLLLLMCIVAEHFRGCESVLVSSMASFLVMAAAGSFAVSVSHPSLALMILIVFRTSDIVLNLE